MTELSTQKKPALASRLFCFVRREGVLRGAEMNDGCDAALADGKAKKG